MHKYVPLQHKSSATLLLVTFFLISSITIISSFYPAFLKQFVQTDERVGFLSVLLYIAVFISLMLITPHLSRKSHVVFFNGAIVIMIIATIALPFVQNAQALFIAEMVRTVCFLVALTRLGLLIKELSPKKYFNDIEGYYFSAQNLAALIGPIIGGILFAITSYYHMFFLSAGLMLCVLLFTYKLEAPLQTPTIFSLKETIILCLKNPKFLTLYSLACIPSAYWIYLYLFYPLYATTLGYSATAIGITLGLAMLPLILFEPFIGSNYHKYSAKKLCTIGCAIVFSVFLLALVCPASYLPTLLIIAAIGIAFLEPTIETYFFQRISNEELYTVFRTNSLIGRILCLGVLSTALLFGSYMNVVACVGFIFVIGIIIARRL